MPFHIDRFRGSPDVQAMHPIAKLGYLMLLASQWQTSDCLISSDPIDLAAASSLGDKLWAQHGPRILRKFETIDGKLRNSVLYIEWMEAKRVFEARQASAHRTNIVRSPSRSPSRSADTQTGTGTGTVTTTEKKQKPSRAKKLRESQAESRARRKKTKASKQRVIDSQSLSAMSAHTEAEADTEAKEQKPSPKPRKRGSEEPTKTALAKDRHDEFKSIVKEYWDSKNKGIQMPWAGPEGKQLEMFLRAAPNITAEQFRGFLRNRFKSEVNHGERPSRWLPWVTSYGAGPVDKFGKTIHSQENSNGRPGTNQPSAARQRVDNNRRALAEAAIKRGWITVDGANGATPAPIPESGQRGFDSGIPDGPRTVEPEVLAPESRRSDSGPAH
jgi:hypothetical protein